MSVWRWMTYNILETGDVSVTSEDVNYPARNLYDRNYSSPFKTADTLALTVHIDQSTAPKAINAFAIPRHNLSSIDIVLEVSDDNANWTVVSSLSTTPANTLIVLTFNTQTPNYARFRTINPTIVQKMGELVIGYQRPVEVRIQAGSSVEINSGAEVLASDSGQLWPVIKSASLDRWSRSVVILPTSTADYGARDQILQLLDDVHKGAKPFWLWDEWDTFRPVLGTFGRSSLVAGSVEALSVSLQEIAL